MKIAITGGAGFVGRNLARSLISAGHEVHIIGRGLDQRESDIYELKGAKFFKSSIADAAGLVTAFEGCSVVAHLAGINREIGEQNYKRIHVSGTKNVIQAAEKQGVKKVIFLSFLRARPNCGSAYHESKWEAEELVRNSGIDYTILKAGVIYGKGDHMLDHLSHAFHTFPVFGLVGMKSKPVRPVAVDEVVEIITAAVLKGRLQNETVSVLGPEELTLAQAVARVAEVAGKKPLFIRLPIVFHRLLAILCEATMKVPLISTAQVRILAEGVVEPGPLAEPLPNDLMPQAKFSIELIKKGLPPAKHFGLSDLRWPLVKSLG